MKKILLTSFIVALGLLGASCKDDNSTAGGGGEILPDQQVSCEIFMPTNGETVIISDKLIIRGEGTTNYGKIISAELKVGGEVITDISSVPFYYEYTFPKEAEPGKLKIELAVKGDHEGSALATITVTTELGDRPAPPQIEKTSQIHVMEMYTRRYNLQTSYGWQKIYAIYRNRILIYLQQRPNIMSCSTVISKQTWEKLI